MAGMKAAPSLRMIAAGIVLLLASTSNTTMADEVHLVGLGESIQQAIDGARSGAVILVRPGRYEESVTLDKAALTLKVLKDHETIVVGLVEISEDGATLSDMLIKRTTHDSRAVTISVRRGHADVIVANNIVDGDGDGGFLSRGIRLSQAGAVIRNNIVRNHIGNGIWVETGEHDVLIAGNIIESNRDGPNFQSSDDEQVVHIRITHNHFINSTSGGIAIGGWV